MYSILLIMVVLLATHYIYNKYRRRACDVPHILDAQSREQYHDIVSKIETDDAMETELQTFLDELKN
jgi:hypothetical protein